MPIFEFLCPDCNEKFEEFIRTKGEPQSLCPKCHKKSQRIFSPCSLNFAAWIPEWKRTLDYANQPEP